MLASCWLNIDTLTTPVSIPLKFSIDKALHSDKLLIRTSVQSGIACFVLGHFANAKSRPASV